MLAREDMAATQAAAKDRRVESVEAAGRVSLAGSQIRIDRAATEAIAAKVESTSLAWRAVPEEMDRRAVKAARAALAAMEHQAR
jgi:hypothetical protein